MTRPDLAALLTPLVRSLVAAELPILAEHGLSMWGYVVLSALDDPVRSQAALAEAIGADKTRIISTLDELQASGLIRRDPDPADRRVRTLARTTKGAAVRFAARTAIQANEDRVLASLPVADRKGFLRAALALAELPREEIVGVAVEV